MVSSFRLSLLAPPAQNHLRSPSVVTTDSLSSPQDEIHTFLFVSFSLLSLPDKSRALGNKKYYPGRCRGRRRAPWLPALWAFRGGSSCWSCCAPQPGPGTTSALATAPKTGRGHSPQFSRQLPAPDLDACPSCCVSSLNAGLDTCSRGLTIASEVRAWTRALTIAWRATSWQVELDSAWTARPSPCEHTRLLPTLYPRPASFRLRWPILGVA